LLLNVANTCDSILSPALDISEGRCRLKTLHQSPIRIKSKENSMPPVRYREPRKSAVPCRIQLLFSDQMVVSQPSLVHGIGSNKLWITDKTVANQIWWFFQPFCRFTVLAKPYLQLYCAYSSSLLIFSAQSKLPVHLRRSAIKAGSENGPIKTLVRVSQLLMEREIPMTVGTFVAKCFKKRSERGRTAIFSEY
jgi:hypothetical protein